MKSKKQEDEGKYMIRSFITWTLHSNISGEIKPRWISRLQNVLEQTLSMCIEFRL
jgi:hypothetical protein